MNAPRFDRVARVYRTLEYLSFGRLLERCRFHHLPALGRMRRALVLGDGDGRFLARLLEAHSHLHAHAVDASPAMLRLLRARAARQKTTQRLAVTCADVRLFTPSAGSYDLVVTHFFLDCLTSDELDRLVGRLTPSLAPGAFWLVSEFAVPSDAPLRAALARALIFGLYAAFRLLTGLRVRRIPPWPEALGRAGFRPCASQTWLGGLLVSELWQAPEATAPLPAQSHQMMRESVLKSPAFPNNLPGIDPGPLPSPTPTPDPTPDPAPGPAPEPDPIPYPGPLPAPQPVT